MSLGFGVLAELGSSVAPVYVNFSDLEEVRDAVVEQIVHISREILEETGTGRPFRDIGLASIRFARRYPVVSRDLTLRPNRYLGEYRSRMEVSLAERMEDGLSSLLAQTPASARPQRTGVEAIDLMELDTSSRKSFETFVQKFTAGYPRLDILIHNAAYFNHGEPYRLNPEGMEIAFATNVVGPYLLTTLLREHLGRAEDPGVLNVGSNIIKHYFSPKMTMDLSDLHGLPAERYFRITTAPEFRGVTGRNINHRLEIMHPAPTTTPEGKPLRFMDEIRITAGAAYYPAIAEDRELHGAVLKVCWGIQNGKVYSEDNG